MRIIREQRIDARQDQCSEEKEAMEASTRMCSTRNRSHSLLHHSSNFAQLTLMTVCILAVSGCASSTSSSKPKVDAIIFADVNGTAKTTPTSLTVSQGTYVDVTLADDPKLLGADWSVYCGSALPPGTPLPTGQTEDESCGTFTPGHTASCLLSGTPSCLPSYITSSAGYVAFYVAPAAPPKQGTVTLYASATSDHSRVASVTLNIAGLPISVGFAPAPPSSLSTGTSKQFRAVLNNDNTNAGVNWTAVCGASACGSFNPAQTTSGVDTTYTAPASSPAGGNVQITATSVADPTKAVAATIQIVP